MVVTRIKRYMYLSLDEWLKVLFPDGQLELFPVVQRFISLDDGSLWEYNPQTREYLTYSMQYLEWDRTFDYTPDVGKSVSITRTGPFARVTLSPTTEWLEPVSEWDNTWPVP